MKSRENEETLKRVLSDKDRLISFYTAHNREETKREFNIKNDKLLVRILKEAGYDFSTVKHFHRATRTHESYLAGGVKSSQTQKKSWAGRSAEEKKAWSKKMSETHTDSLYLLKAKLRMKRYFADLSEEDREKINEKRRQTMLSKTPEEKREKLRRCIDTKKKNSSFNISRPEEELYAEIQKIFPSVKRQYSDSRYPWACDFYIPEKDLFVELNLTWTHGGKPYTEDCREQLERWREKGTDYYRQAIYTWADLDVRKRETARKNALHFVELFNREDIERFLARLRFAKSLGDLKYERDFCIGDNMYDFKVGDTLIEIVPTDQKVDRRYNQRKSEIAGSNGYRYICVFGWDDTDKIAYLLKPRPKVYARKCEVSGCTKKEAMEFLEKYHLQGYARDKIRICLRYGGEIVSIMTFGKPRYNRAYQWELIRYCSSACVIGGAQKLFSYFLRNYNPESIISYCDLSKFSGRVYGLLGFTRGANPAPSKHWFDGKIHITDNLLRSQGYSRLIDGLDAKDDVELSTADNRALMLADGFREIYDCGQLANYWHRH